MGSVASYASVFILFINSSADEIISDYGFKGEKKFPHSNFGGLFPKDLTQKSKKGFSIPLGSWLRGPLKDWAENLLNEKRLRQEGYFNSKLIRDKWSEHLSCKHNWENDLWNVLMFQAWLENEHIVEKTP